MIKKLTSYLPAHSLIFILVCIAGILGFLLLTVYPNQRKAYALDRKINTVRTEIEEQKIFMPMYTQLRQIQKSAKQAESADLPLHVEKTGGIESPFQARRQIQQIAESAGMTVEVIEPDVDTIIDNGHITLYGKTSVSRKPLH